MADSVEVIRTPLSITVNSGVAAASAVISSSAVVSSSATISSSVATLNQILINTGSVSIGTTSPASAFHLVGNAQIAGNSYTIGTASADNFRTKGSASVDGSLRVSTNSYFIGTSSFTDTVNMWNAKTINFYNADAPNASKGTIYATGNNLRIDPASLLYVNGNTEINGNLTVGGTTSYANLVFTSGLYYNSNKIVMWGTKDTISSFSNGVGTKTITLPSQLSSLNDATKIFATVSTRDATAASWTYTVGVGVSSLVVKAYNVLSPTSSESVDISVNVIAYV